MQSLLFVIVNKQKASFLFFGKIYDAENVIGGRDKQQNLSVAARQPSFISVTCSVCRKVFLRFLIAPHSSIIWPSFVTSHRTFNTIQCQLYGELLVTGSPNCVLTSAIYGVYSIAVFGDWWAMSVRLLCAMHRQ